MPIEISEKLKEFIEFQEYLDKKFKERFYELFTKSIIESEKERLNK